MVSRIKLLSVSLECNGTKYSSTTPLKISLCKMSIAQGFVGRKKDIIYP